MEDNNDVNDCEMLNICKSFGETPICPFCNPKKAKSCDLFERREKPLTEADLLNTIKLYSNKFSKENTEEHLPTYEMVYICKRFGKTPFCPSCNIRAAEFCELFKRRKKPLKKPDPWGTDIKKPK